MSEDRESSIGFFVVSVIAITEWSSGFRTSKSFDIAKEKQHAGKQVQMLLSGGVAYFSAKKLPFKQ